MNTNMQSAYTRRSFLGVFAAGACAMGLGLAGCSQGAKQDSASGAGASAGAGTLSVGSAFSTQNYDPSSTSSALALSANLNVVEGLYELDFHDYSAHNGLASAEPKKIDEKTFEITLRKDAKFSDGKPVTPEDVVESFTRSNAKGNLYVSMLTPIASIEKKDDSTLTVKTSIPNFSLLRERLAIVRVIPASMSKEDLTAKPVGSGPWKYDEITDACLKLSPNEYYNGEHPAKDKMLRIDVLKDPTARVTAQKEGTTLISEQTPADSIDQLKSAGCTVDTVQGFGTRFMMFNVKKDPWSNVKVRQAVMYALDYDKMIQNALAGMAAAPSSYLPETYTNYNKASHVYTHDVEKAKSLIKEAGITPGAVTLRTTDNDQVVAMATQVKNDLDALGFSVSIQTDTSPATYAAIDGGEAYDMLLAPGDPSCFGADPDLLLNWWYGNNIWMTKRCPWQDSEEWKKLNATMADALQKSGDEQQKAWNTCFDLISENVPLYPVLQVKTSTSSWSENPNAEGTKVTKFSGIGTTGVYLADVATSK